MAEWWLRGKLSRILRIDCWCSLRFTKVKWGQSSSIHILLISSSISIAQVPLSNPSYSSWLTMLPALLCFSFYRPLTTMRMNKTIHSQYTQPKPKPYVFSSQFISIQFLLMWWLIALELHFHCSMFLGWTKPERRNWAQPEPHLTQLLKAEALSLLACPTWCCYHGHCVPVYPDYTRRHLKMRSKGWCDRAWPESEHHYWIPNWSCWGHVASPYLTGPLSQCTCHSNEWVECIFCMQHLVCLTNKHGVCFTLFPFYAWNTKI